MPRFKQLLKCSTNNKSGYQVTDMASSLHNSIRRESYWIAIGILAASDSISCTGHRIQRGIFCRVGSPTIDPYSLVPFDNSFGETVVLLAGKSTLQKRNEFRQRERKREVTRGKKFGALRKHCFRTPSARLFFSANFENFAKNVSSKSTLTFIFRSNIFIQVRIDLA